MTDLSDRLRTALRTALTERDRVAISALRSTLAAIANAEAIDTEPTAVPTGPADPGGSEPTTAGTTIGVGATEANRRELTDDDLRTIVAGEISERQEAAELYQRSGQGDQADRLRREAAVLDQILSQT